MFRFLLAYLYFLWGNTQRHFGNRFGTHSSYEAAARNLNRAYELDKSMREARMNRAVLLWRELNREQEAISELDSMLVEDPAFAPALLNRGLAYQQQGAYSTALEDLRAYLQLPPDDIEYSRHAQRMISLLEQTSDADPTPPSEPN
jgi:tetratricopeptide (TPR) repeat protein